MRTKEVRITYHELMKQTVQPGDLVQKDPFLDVVPLLNIYNK